MLTIEPHDLLDAASFVTTFPQPLERMPVPESVTRLFELDAVCEWSSSDEVRDAVRSLLRWGGFKPTGRSKPASEYLLKAVREQLLGSINLAVDVCNVVSLHSGLPISVIDLDRSLPPYRIAIAGPGSQYVFNASGQSIDISGLVGLEDKLGPCANAVKDAQRTKTGLETRRTLSIVWGTRALPGRAEGVSRWYRQILNSQGAVTDSC